MNMTHPSLQPSPTRGEGAFTQSLLLLANDRQRSPTRGEGAFTFEPLCKIMQKESTH